jgi:hypothetical protein
MIGLIRSHCEPWLDTDAAAREVLFGLAEGGG